jgi:hypothetical protein
VARGPSGLLAYRADEADVCYVTNGIDPYQTLRDQLCQSEYKRDGEPYSN